MVQQKTHVVCAQIGCGCKYVQHRWGAIKAHDQGWFLQKDGTAWCPDHAPSWVDPWRASQQ